MPRAALDFLSLLGWLSYYPLASARKWRSDTCFWSTSWFSSLTLWTTALLMAIVNLGILIPNAPGGIGLFEFIGVALLLPFGIGKEMAVGYMFLVHFMVLIPHSLDHRAVNGHRQSGNSHPQCPGRHWTF